MVKAWEPDWCIRPGLTIRDELNELGIDVREAAAKIGIRPEILQDVINGDQEIDEPIAMRLAKLGVSPQFWLNLERQYRDGLAAGKRDVSDDD